MNKILKSDIFFIFNREVSGYFSTFFSLGNKYLRIFSPDLRVFLFGIIFILSITSSYSQVMNQPYYFNNGNQPNNNYMANSTAFRQEIARMEITVYREGRKPLSLTQVPRVQNGDILKFKLLDEPVNGIKLDQSNYDWTLLVAFVNPNRKNSDDKQGSVSQEIQFRKTGWYREYFFTVPFDSQPIIFLYPRPKYRDKIMKLINKNYNEIRKLGEKTIEIAGAYAQIGMFLNELQGVLNGNPYGNNGSGSNGYGTNTFGSYPNYGATTIYGTNTSGFYGNQGYNYNSLLGQSVERLARSFNIQIPNNCIQGGVSYSGGGYGINNQNGVSPEIVNRLQCIAKSVRFEDFDFSVSRLLQQGGILAASQLSRKYPQFAYWISIAAVAIDLIIKITQKTPLKIVPTVATSTDNPNGNYGGYGGGNYQNNLNQPNYQNNLNQPNYQSNASSYSPNQNNQNQPVSKISLFAENQPDDNQFVTAYPIVLHKWQAEADPEVISLRPPVLMEPCLHAGVNVLKSTDLMEDQLSDNFTRDYTLMMNSTSGFRKEFPLKKNLGLGGWELNITPQDLTDFPKIQMTLKSVIKGTRGFNEIKSPPFYLPISIGGNWEVNPESQKEFSVGGKRMITIKNNLGNCRCLQAVIYKPSFGGQFVYEAEGNSGSSSSSSSGSNQNVLQYSPDGKEVSFEVDATSFQPGAGQLELRTYGGEAVKLSLKLYPQSPNITNLKIGKGHREAIIAGERLEQLSAVKINGRRAFIAGQQTQTNQLPNGNQTNGVTPTANPKSNDYAPNLNANGPNERVVVFEDERTIVTENTVTLELELEDNRIIRIERTFSVAPARPTIVANENGEIEGVAISSLKSQVRSPGSAAVEVQNQSSQIKGQTPKTKAQSSSVDLSNLPVFPIDTSEISLNVQNALTDYDFKVENLWIETRMEKSQPSQTSVNNNSVAGAEIPLPKVNLEVLDWKNLKISVQLSEPLQKMLGGRRLQFRIRDRERGDSNWYSIKQTFVRLPEIKSISCSNEMKDQCQLNGLGIEYISQISIDGGQTWYPQSPATLQVQPTQEGQANAVIPLLQNKKSFQIKLRDFPEMKGIWINNFLFSNLVRGTKKPIKIE